MGLADHGWIAVGGGIVFGRIQASVQDAIGIVCVWKAGDRCCVWAAGLSATHATRHRWSSTVATAGGPTLVLPLCGLGLEIISIQRFDMSHRSYLAIFGEVDLEGFGVVLEPERGHGE